MPFFGVFKIINNKDFYVIGFTGLEADAFFDLDLKLNIWPFTLNMFVPAYF